MSEARELLIEARIAEADLFGDRCADTTAIRAIEVALRSGDGWKPIETAPKDGPLLGWVPGNREEKRIAMVQMRNGKPFIVNGSFAFDCPPVTHWRHVPSPPAREG